MKNHHRLTQQEEMLEKILAPKPYNTVSKLTNRVKTVTGKCSKCKIATHSTKDGVFLCCICNTPKEKFSESSVAVRSKPPVKVASVTAKRQKRKTDVEKRKMVLDWDKSRRAAGKDVSSTSYKVRMLAWAKSLKIKLRDFKPAIYSNRTAKGSPL